MFHPRILRLRYAGIVYGLLLLGLVLRLAKIAINASGDSFPVFSNQITGTRRARRAVQCMLHASDSQRTSSTARGKQGSVSQSWSRGRHRLASRRDPLALLATACAVVRSCTSSDPLPHPLCLSTKEPRGCVSICNTSSPRRPALRARLSNMMLDPPKPRSSSPELPNTHPCARANGMAPALTPGAAASEAHLSPRSPEPLPPSPMVPRRAARIAHAMVLSCVAVRRGCAAAARWRRLARRRRRAPLLTRRGLAARSARLPGRRPPARS